MILVFSRWSVRRTDRKTARKIHKKFLEKCIFSEILLLLNYIKIDQNFFNYPLWIILMRKLNNLNNYQIYHKI
jgi:hypothetical protein